MSWGPVYPLLRRLTPLPSLVAGLLTGASLSLLVDEGLTPLLGFSAPNRAYPLSTHVRGFVAHLVYGLSVAIVAESIAFLGRVSPSPRSLMLRRAQERPWTTPAALRQSPLPP